MKQFKTDLDDESILKLQASYAVKEYKDVLIEGLHCSFPDLTVQELDAAINYSILKRCKNIPSVDLDNNYMKRLEHTNIIDILDYIHSREPIVTSSGVIFRKHKDSDNPLSRMIMGFIKERKKLKKEMFKYPKGSAEFEKYNLFQLLEKLNANAVYGVLGNNTSMFYNVYVAEAITRQGRSYISCSIMFFESFLANNVKFNSLNEIMIFIKNVLHEKDERKILDSGVLDRNITVEECFCKLTTSIDMLYWVPTNEELQLIWERILNLTPEDINRLYYKNNLYTFCELPVVETLLKGILVGLQEPFMNPNEPPKEVKDKLDTLVSLLKEYVYYKYPYIDKLDRIEYMQRDVVAISDTDSTIVSFDAWYRFLLNKVYDLDMPIKHQKYNMVDIIKADEFGDRPLRVMAEEVEPEFDYNFYTDEVIEQEQLIAMTDFLPQDGLKYSIINTIAYVCSALIVDYLNEYTKRTGSYSPDRKCLMVMKNEFYFLSVLLTDNRRNYADYQVLQEGNIVPESEAVAIMGLPINKSTLSTEIKKKLKVILEDILKTGKADQLEIMKRLALLEKEIYQSLANKETKYYKPEKLKAASSFEHPMNINGVVASMIYNKLRSENDPAINLEETNNILKVKISVTKDALERCKERYPEIYEKMLAIMADEKLGKKLTTIAFPTDTIIPDWVLEFIDYKTIINDSVKNFPLESIGLRRVGNDSVNYSNIINLF